MPGLVAYVGSTEAEARARQRELDELLPVESSLRQLQSFIFQDCMNWELDRPVPPLPPLADFKGPKGRYATILRIIETEQPTVRQLLGRLAAGGGHFTVVGTPEQDADRVAQWVRNDGADGFHLMPPMLPHSREAVVDHVATEMHRHRTFRTKYAHSSLHVHPGMAHHEG